MTYENQKNDSPSDSGKGISYYYAILKSMFIGGIIGFCIGEMWVHQHNYGHEDHPAWDRCYAEGTSTAASEKCINEYLYSPDEANLIIIALTALCAIIGFIRIYNKHVFNGIIEGLASAFMFFMIGGLILTVTPIEFLEYGVTNKSFMYFSASIGFIYGYFKRPVGWTE